MIILEFGSFVFGIWLTTRSRLRLGERELRAPFTQFAGILLALQLPLAVGMGFAVGGAEAIKFVREGLDPGASSSVLVKKYWWLDLALVGTTVAIVGVIVLTNLRVPVSLPPPPDDPVGVSDLRNRLIELEVPWEGPEAIPRDPNEPFTEMAIRESRRSSIRS